MVKKKIAISGKARTGKNTLAEMIGAGLYAKNKANYKIFAFADPIKEMIMLMFPTMNPQILWGPSELRSSTIANTDKTYRMLLTEIGKLGRSYDTDIWVNATIGAIDKYINETRLGELLNHFGIISDVRFSNELETIKNNGFVTIRIVRPNNDYVVDDVSEKDLDHITDDNFDFLIVNDGSLEQLKEKAQTIVNQLE